MTGPQKRSFYEIQEIQTRKTLLVFAVLILFYFIAVGLITLAVFGSLSLFLTSRTFWTTFFIRRILLFDLAAAALIEKDGKIWFIKNPRGNWAGPLAIDKPVSIPFFTSSIAVSNSQQKNRSQGPRISSDPACPPQPQPKRARRPGPGKQVSYAQERWKGWRTLSRYEITAQRSVLTAHSDNNFDQPAEYDRHRDVQPRGEEDGLSSDLFPEDGKGRQARDEKADKDCGNPRCGFARIHCPDCGEERLLMFSYRTRGFCPSCHAKRLEVWGVWMHETLLLDVPPARSSSPSPGCCGSSSSTSAGSWGIFAREVLADLVRKELLSPEWAERLLSWRHTGFSVHSLVRAKASVDAERVGKYMIPRSFPWNASPSYRFGKGPGEQETMDYLEFIARVTSHIPDKGQVMVRYYGLYANAHGGRSRRRIMRLFLSGLLRTSSGASPPTAGPR